MSGTSEPTITVNGVPLTIGQAMTVRVALNSLAVDLRSDGMGDDEHGRRMTEGYLTAIGEIFRLMSAKTHISDGTP